MLFSNLALDPKLTGLNLGSPSWDSFIVLGYLGAVFIYSFFASRERLVTVLMSLYASLAIVQGTPLLLTYFAGIPDANYPWYRLGVFVGSFALLFLLLSRNVGLKSSSGKWWQGFVLSALQVGLLASSILMFIPAAWFQSTLAQEYFTGDLARTIWMVSPVLVMAVMKNKSKDGE